MKKAMFLVAVYSCFMAPGLGAQDLAPSLGVQDRDVPELVRTEREYIAALVRSGGDVIQSQLEDLTMVSTYESFVINMPDETIQERGVVARVIDRAGRHVAELLVIESAELVVWKRYGEDGSGPLETVGFDLKEVALEDRFTKGNPAKALSWAHEMLLNIWKNGPYDPHLSMDKDPEGCSGVHWLDNSNLRPCCDDHDICFRADDCMNEDLWGWNPATASWECGVCNYTVVACFAINILLEGIFWEWCWGGCGCSGSIPCIIIECM